MGKLPEDSRMRKIKDFVEVFGVMELYSSKQNPFSRKRDYKYVISIAHRG